MLSPSLLLLLQVFAFGRSKSEQTLLCPAGSQQIGTLNADIAGCGLEGCDARYQENYSSIEDCLAGCNANVNCESFSWAPLNGDRNHAGKSVCSLYDDDIPTQLWSPQQILCTPIAMKNVAFECQHRKGSSKSGVGATSTVSCQAGETMVSCGIKGWEHIGGAYIDEAQQQCVAISHDPSNGVQAVANCCAFPSGVILDASTVVSGSAGTNVTAQCPPDSVLTGCHSYYASGTYDQLLGAFAGAQSAPPQTTAWIETHNECTAQSRAGTSVLASAQCLQLESAYSLDCKTKAQYTTKKGFVGCDRGYSIMSCNTLNTLPAPQSIDAYFLDGKGHCYVQQDGWKDMYANAICCRLQTPDQSAASSSQTDDDCHSAKVTVHCDNTLYAYVQRDRNDAPTLLESEQNWQHSVEFTVANVTGLTVLQFTCIDHGYVGGFIATVEYGAVQYSTLQPMSASLFEIVDGDTSTLVYHEKTASPWHIATDEIADEAMWVWNDETQNTMKFAFDFGHIIAGAVSNNGSASAFLCDCNSDCVIYCDLVDARQGCSNQVIDGRHARSLTVYCDSSKNALFGGCQFATIHCPQRSDGAATCTIECRDYFGCYLAQIYASNVTSVTCAHQEGSCLKTVVHANDSSTLNVSCYGGGVLGTKSHSACHGLQLYADELQHALNLLCWDDFACFALQVYAQYARAVNIHARGHMALSSSYLYTADAVQLQLFCGSEASEFGCYQLYVYAPSYASLGAPRTRVSCQGHGCYDELYLYSAHGALDVAIAVDGCGECDTLSSCVAGWYFYCATTTFDVFDGTACASDACDCSYAMNQITDVFVSSSLADAQCDVFTLDYECPPGADCVIDCDAVWPDDNGCSDKVIDGANATSLTVLCGDTLSTWSYGACESAHIFCPYRDSAPCNVVCDHRDACYDLEVSIKNDAAPLFYLRCNEADSCSHTNVYGARNDDITIDCMTTDACDDINITAHFARNISIHCRGDGDHNLDSYSSCVALNVWAENVTDTVELRCDGDYSCYGVNVYADYAHHVSVESKGDHGAEGGNIYAAYAKSMRISCKSMLHEYGCYRMRFYIPSSGSSTTLECQGHGCYFLSMYAVHGFADLSTISVAGCGECSGNECVNTWQMHCGDAYALDNVYHGHSVDDDMVFENTCETPSLCECDSDAFRAAYLAAFNTDDSCDLLAADESCEDGVECRIDCSTTASCTNHVMLGHNASALSLHCGANGCSSAQIYCPPSACHIICSDSDACAAMTVTGEAETRLTIECTAPGACASISIDIADTRSANISCTAYAACAHISLYADDADNVTLSCVGVENNTYSYSNYYMTGYYDYDSDVDTDDVAAWQPVCDHITIHAERASQLTLNCIGNDACYPSAIVADYARRVTVNAIGSYSLFRGWLSAKFVTDAVTLNLQSYGGHKYGVENVRFYLPPDAKTSLNCVGYGCHTLSLYAADGVLASLRSLQFASCTHCVKPESCVNDWQLFCGASYLESATFTGSTCDDASVCGCGALIGEIEDSFSEALESELSAADACGGTATVEPDFECSDASEICRIECTVDNDCSRALIFGGDAASLTVVCAHNSVCSGVEIYCPERSDSECNVICSGYDACFSAVIYGDHRNRIHVTATERFAFEYGLIYAYDALEVNVTCAALEACYDVNVYASQAAQVNVLCDASTDDLSYNSGNMSSPWYLYYYGYENRSPCYALSVYASSVTQRAQLRCRGQYACFSTHFDAQNAKQVVVYGEDAPFAMEQTVVDVSNAAAFELNCMASQKGSRGCAEAHIYYPLKTTAQQSLTAIHCYGFCDNIYFYVGDVGLGALATADIQVHSCGVCQSSAECIGVWYVYCNGLSTYDRAVGFNGVSCMSAGSSGAADDDDSEGDICQCAQYQSVVHSQSAFVSDSDMCVAGGLVPPPPEVSSLSSNDTGDAPQQQKNKKKPVVLILVLVILVVVVLCAVGNMVYCWRRRVNEKIASEILAQEIRADEGGVEEIALEPMEHNIGPNISREKNSGKYVELNENQSAGDGAVTGAATGVSVYALAGQ